MADAKTDAFIAELYRVSKITENAKGMEIVRCYRTGPKAISAAQENEGRQINFAYYESLRAEQKKHDEQVKMGKLEAEIEKLRSLQARLRKASDGIK